MKTTSLTAVLKQTSRSRHRDSTPLLVSRGEAEWESLEAFVARVSRWRSWCCLAPFTAVRTILRADHVVHLQYILEIECVNLQC